MNHSKKLFLRCLTAFLLSALICLSAFAENTDNNGALNPADDGSGTSAETSETTTEPTTEPTTAPTTEPTTAPTTTPEPKVTKDPTGEEVYAGETALFVARADNCTTITWLVLSPDNRNTYTIAQAEGVYSGLRVSGEKTETLRLENIPISMNGASIYAEFTGAGGKATSKPALLTVRKAKLVAPSIMQNPKSAAVKEGEPVTLTVKVIDSNEGTKLYYQWYSTTDRNAVGGTQIGGAMSDTYTPDTTIEGTLYYYVKVWSKSDDQTGPAVTSEVASVSVAPLAPTTEATTEETTEATTEAATEAATEETLPLTQPKKKNKTGLVVALFILLILSFVATVAAIVLMRRDAALEADDYDDEDDFGGLSKLPDLKKLGVFGKMSGAGTEAKYSAEPAKTPAPQSAPKPVPKPVSKAPAASTAPTAPVVPKAAAAPNSWICLCGAENHGSFCTDCGSPKPSDPMQTICENCGFDASALPKTPKFCPNCGQPFNILDYEF